MKFFLLSILFALAYAGPIQERNDVVNYLIRYGYLEKAQLHNRQSVFHAIQKLQKMARIPETGIVDQATIEFTKKPRCGLPDFVNGQPRVNRDVAWDKTSLTYHIGEKTADLTEEQYADNMKLALDTWAKYVKLNFSRVLDVQDADIVSYFGSRDHGCGVSFDGPSGVLAHAYFPQNGDIHFDNDEVWNLTGERGFDFFSVALHELGHSIGLDHSDVPEAVMFPTYSVWTELSQDDIDRIQQLYPSAN
ncbi:hypothetical protein RI129_005917 [Pyrocoelia pectoralis]|uniref:Peptidase metallopeptidase domain-containing protein n=1 Tax=Pyrocoelia pectoralis TaxID=417401 RepID=A0AAN7ZJB9_9COLE